MELDDFERIFRGNPMLGPHTIRSPIRYEVWRNYALLPDHRVDLLLEAKESTDHVAAAQTLIDGLARIGADPGTAELALSDDVVAISLTFPDFLRLLVPLTDWRLHAEHFGDPALTIAELTRELEAALDGLPPGPEDLLASRPGAVPLTADRVVERWWFGLLAARIGLQTQETEPLAEEMASWLQAQFALAYTSHTSPFRSISVNRAALSTVSRSRATIKADAAVRLFDIDASKVGWAVIDSGIDATHPAFRRLDPLSTPAVPYTRPFERTETRWENRTRVVQTFDLLDVRKTLQVTSADELRGFDIGERIDRACAIPMDEGYRPPRNTHGTHVAGILGASWTHSQAWSPTGDGPWAPEVDPIIGVCPTVTLYDFRVLGDDGRGDEFAILTALNHILRINADAGRMVIKGVNLSLSITHDVANYACGWTPICQACERLVDNGVVVVVSAGNTGFRGSQDRKVSDGTNYLPISITDPGNAENVLTVGATHRELPYRYGVSYFSSRGPTADGRRKPDVLAPGEGIVGPVGPSDRATLDGTSQAAPHVSGAAALLLARYPELTGQPERVKRILCETASDLGRDPAFQGHGLIDILRALQST